MLNNQLLLMGDIMPDYVLGKRLYVDALHLRENPRDNVVTRTRTGYGTKLNTGRQVFYKNRWRTIWCDVYSNIGRSYIVVNNQNVIVE